MLGKPQGLDQPVLQGLEQPLYAALGSAAAGADGFDAQLQQRTLELGGYAVLDVVLGEDAVVAAVQRQRHAVLRDVAAQHVQVALCRLGGVELRSQYPPRGVVDEGRQVTARAACLEPVVMAAVDLDQFAQALSTWARWMHALGSSQLGLPQPGPHHPAPQRLGAVHKAVLSRQFGAKVGVVSTHQVQRLVSPAVGVLV